MNIDAAFPSDYLKASDIPQGRRATVVIENVTIENIGKTKDQRPVVYFQGKEKGLVLNKTNARMISAITGSGETEHWRGRQIALYSTIVEYQGKPVPALRVDYPPAQSNGAAARPSAQVFHDAPDLDTDEIPF